MRGFKIAEFFVGWSTWFYRHFAAKLCILRIVSGFRNNDAPFVLLLFFLFFDRSDKFLTFTRFLTFTTDTKLCVYPMHSLASYWTRRSFGSSMSIRLSLQYMLPAEVHLFLVGFFSKQLLGSMKIRLQRKIRNNRKKLERTYFAKKICAAGNF